ncbi:MAG: sugar-binding transcriptional regulator [Stappiaceae bacterium]
MDRRRLKKQETNSDTSMATRAAWLHYAGGLTQSEVAKRLGLTSLKAHRLITRANQDGLVKVFVDGDVTECVELEAELSGKYGLDYCEVVPDFDNSDLPLKALGIAGAKFLKREIEQGKYSLIGVGHGRSLAACVDHLPAISASNTDFVSMLGGFSRKFSANPHVVIHRLAERTGGQAFVMPVPFYANSEEDKNVLLSQRGMAEVLDMARNCELKVVGIGTTEPDASLIATGMIEPDEFEEAKAAGGVAELLGHFLNGAGEAITTALSERTMSLPLADVKNSKIVAIAGGTMKIRAIRSVLRSRFLSGLITDERSARALMELRADC